MGVFHPPHTPSLATPLDFSEQRIRDNGSKHPRWQRKMDESEDEEVLLFVLLLRRRRRRLQALNRQTLTKRWLPLMTRHGQGVYAKLLRFHYYACAVQTNPQADSFRALGTRAIWRNR